MLFNAMSANGEKSQVLILVRRMEYELDITILTRWAVYFTRLKSKCSDVLPSKFYCNLYFWHFR